MTHPDYTSPKKQQAANSILHTLITDILTKHNITFTSHLPYQGKSFIFIPGHLIEITNTHIKINIAPLPFTFTSHSGWTLYGNHSHLSRHEYQINDPALLPTITKLLINLTCTPYSSTWHDHTNT